MKTKLILTILLSQLILGMAYAKPNNNESSHYSNDWETLHLKGLNLLRLEVPNGWLVREGLGKFGGLALDAQERVMLFVPDSKHEWSTETNKSWETLKLKGLNLYRLRTPEGWLVREGYGKIGSAQQTQGMLFMEDKLNTWHVQSRN